MNSRAPAPATPAPPALTAPEARPLRWLLALCVAHVLVRLAISPALKWDEAEQMLWSQTLALGYGAQPPLYTWLQWGVNQVLGPGVAALAVLKHTLLALAFVCMYQAGRTLLGPRGAWWGAASMLLLPALGWHSVRDQTHTVLVTTMTCAAWWLLLRIARRPRPADFAWLGAVCAAGVLAKYSFALVMAAMLAAALSVPHTRRALLSRGWWLAPLTGALLVIPHGLWLLTHLQEASAETLEKMQLQTHGGVADGLRSLFTITAGTLLPFALLALWAFGRAWWTPAPAAPHAPNAPDTPDAPDTPAPPAWATALFLRYLLLVLAALIGMVALAGVTSFKERWLLPLLCVVPLAAFAARPALAQHPRARRYTGAVLAVALLFWLAAGARPWLGNLNGKPDELNHPITALAQALRDRGYDGISPIVAGDHMLAGMLRTRFAHAPVAACMQEQVFVAPCVQRHARQAQAAGRGLLLITRGDRPAIGWWQQAGRRPPLPPGEELTLPYHLLRADIAPATYTLVWLPPGSVQAAPPPTHGP